MRVEMKRLPEIIWITAVIVLFTVSAFAQQTEWQELMGQSFTLYQQGRYSEATKVAEEALKVAENTFDKNHLNVGQTLNILAVLYQSQSKYAEAELFYKRSLAIWEKALGPDHPNVATSLENLAVLYRATNRESEAKNLEAEAARIRAVQR